MGYSRAGFEIVGVDIKPQPRYPFTFVQGDALEYLKKHWREFDAIHASPPCQLDSWVTPRTHKQNHPDLIEPTRQALLEIGLPFVVENVGGARHKLTKPVKLCGSMFDLKSFRHRYFELSGFQVGLVPDCNHNFQPLLVTTAGSNSRAIRSEGNYKSVKNAPLAYGIDWMTADGLKEAIPPAYTEFLGRYLIAALTNTQSPAPLLGDANDAKFLSPLKEGVSFGGNR